MASARSLPSLPKNKRERTISSDDLLLQSNEPRIVPPLHKSRPTPYAALASPLLPHLPSETKSSYFERLEKKVEKHLFSPAHSFDKDGIYIYKRPVRSASPQHAALLAQAGSVFNHVVVYIKRGGDLMSLEYGPNNGMDVTSSILEEAPAAPLLNTSPDHPESQHLPMLHIRTDHHSIDAAHVKQALDFAASKAYSVIKNNCIAVADFTVRVLTGNRVKNSPLIFDYLVGSVPEMDSPLLPMLQVMTQMTWFNIADGSRLMLEFLNAHGAHTIIMPPSAVPAEDAGLAAAEGAPGVTTAGGTEDRSWSDDISAKIAVGGEKSSAIRKIQAKLGKSGPRLPPRRHRQPKHASTLEQPSFVPQ